MDPLTIFPQLGSTKTGAAAQSQSPGNAASSENAELKRVAMEFEAIMLAQLTSALRSESGDDEDSFFGKGESNLAQQMFEEQLAVSMAKGGGIGLAGLIERQLNPNKDASSISLSPFKRMAETVRHLRNSAAPPAAANIASSNNAFTESVETLQQMTRPRRVADLLNAEPSSDANAVKLPQPQIEIAERASVETIRRASVEISSEMAAIKQAFAEAPALPSQPSNEVQPKIDATTDASVESLRQMTRPRRVADLVNVESAPETNAVKLPPLQAEAMGRAFVEAPARIEVVKRAFIAAPSSQSSFTGQPRVDVIIEQASARHDIDPHLLAAVLRTESAGRQTAVSHKGASGYMQMMPETFREFAGPGKSIFDPTANINAGAAYLKHLSDKYDGNLDKVLAGYNAGMGNVEKYGGIPPFKETRNFVATVKRRYREFLAAAEPSAPSASSGLAASRAAASNRQLRIEPASFMSKPIIARTVVSPSARDAVIIQKPPSAARGITFKSESRDSSVNSVDLQIPVQGRISSAFGARRRHGNHKGVDIAVPRGTPIEAAGTGKVVFAGWSRGYGKTVLIKHQEGFYTRYAHAEKILVSHGDSVQAGEQVATVGSTGRATGPHLHFEVLRDGRRVNPLRAVAENLGQRVAVKIER